MERYTAHTGNAITAMLKYSVRSIDVPAARVGKEACVIWVLRKSLLFGHVCARDRMKKRKHDVVGV
jgi:hypothetical protein